MGFLYPPTQNTNASNVVNSHVAAVASAAAAASSANMAAASGANMMMAGGAFMSPLGSGQGEIASLPTSMGDEKKKTHASTRAKPISCLAFSPDGNYLAAGEVDISPTIGLEPALIKFFCKSMIDGSSTEDFDMGYQGAGVIA